MTQRMPKLAPAAAMLVVGGLVLAGCSGGSDGKSADGKVKLTMVESLTAPARTATLRSILDDCEAKIPGVEVELISPPTEQADQKVQQMLQAGSGIDILEVRDLTVGPFSANGWIADMRDDFADWDGRDALASNTLAVIDGGDAMYMMPYGFFGLATFYRTDLVEEAGFAGAPETWDDLYEQAVTINDPDENTFGFAFRGGRNGFQQAVQVMETYLADKVDLDNAYLLQDGSTIFAAPESKDALKLYVNLFENASPPSSISWGFPEMVEGFANGSTAFLMQDPEVITVFQEDSALTSEQWNTAPAALGPQGKAFQTLAVSGWGIAESGKNKDESIEMIKCMSEGDLSLRFSQENNQIPILAEGTESDYYKQGPWESYFVMSENPETWIQGSQPRSVSWWQEWSEKADSELQQVLTGSMTQDDLLASWDQYWTEKLAEN